MNDIYDNDLPKSSINKVLTAAVNLIFFIFKKGSSSFNSEKQVPDFIISKEIRTAFKESAKLFISYLSATANDQATNAKRQTVSPEDVINAIKELEFDDFVKPLEETLEKYQSNKTKKTKK